MGVLLHIGFFDRVRAGQVSAASFAAREPVILTGRVYQKDSESIFIQSVSILQQAVDSQQKIPCNDNFICMLDKTQDVPLGSVVTVEGSFYPFSAAANPGEFDSAEYYKTLGIGGRIKDASILSRGERKWPFREALHQLRCRLKGRLEAVFPKKEAAIMCALLLGDKARLDTDVKELYQRNGILHILSISSLHITMLGMSVYRLLRKCRLPVYPAAAAGCILLLAYGAMTGFGVSACRAVGMYLLRMLSEVLGRTYDMLTALGAMAVVMLLINPYYLHHAGFLLSFTSILGMGLVYPALSHGKKHNKKKIKKTPAREIAGRMQGALREALLSGVSITLATLPVQLWFYYQTPSYAVFLNILVLPLMKPVMGAGFLTLLPGFGFAGFIDRLVLGVYELLCTWFDRLPFHTWNPGRPRLWQVAAYYLILLLMVCWKDHQRKKGQRQPIFLTAAPLLAVWVIGLRPPLQDQAICLDVGQGDCILVRTSSGANYLFDCGSSSRSQTGRYVLLPCLRYYGIRTLDGIFLSHPDDDHVNGALELLAMGKDSGIEVKQLILPKMAPETQAVMEEQLWQDRESLKKSLSVPVRFLGAGEGWQCENAEFLCLHPGKDWTGIHSNEYSMCIYGEFREEQGNGFSLLLTGDVEGQGEEALLKELKERDIKGVTVLKAAHHGSRNSSSESFLEQVKPSVTVISCGRGNRYGHPHEELLERLLDSGTLIRRTDTAGAVTVIWDETNRAVRVKTWR